MNVIKRQKKLNINMYISVPITFQSKHEDISNNISSNPLILK